MALAHNEQDIIYDRFGSPRLRILTKGMIVTWGGKHIGLLKNNLVYNYSGRRVG